MKVFVAPERRSKAPWVLTLLAFLLFGAGAFYLFSGPPAPIKPAAPVVRATPPPPVIPVAAPTVAPALPEPPLLDAHFDRNDDGFQYVVDAFRATKNPAYATGSRREMGAPHGGVLVIHLGGGDAKDIRGMSAGWKHSFKVGKPGPLVLSFRYELIQTSEYEDDEFSQALVSVDGLQLGAGGKDYIAQLTGDGNGGLNPTTGWQTFSVSLGQLAPGTHELKIGAFNNKKTAVNETTDLGIDDVRIETAPPGGVPAPTLPTIAAPIPKVKVPPTPSTNKVDDTF
jgi:hypothetical protein